MAPDPNAYHGSYTSLAMDCKHVIHFSVPSALEIKLSRPASTYSEPLDWDDQYPPIDFVCESANTLLCPSCEAAMRKELRDAEANYKAVWADGNGDSRNETGERSPEHKDAARRYNRAVVKVANFEDRMANRANTISQAAAKAAKEQMWEAGREVKFAKFDTELESIAEEQDDEEDVSISSTSSRDSAVELAEAWAGFDLNK